jgi:PiT family inorganic phosphate transporter
VDPLTFEAIIAFTIIAAIVFAFSNGVNDVSSAVATLIGCRAATPLKAVIIASIANFLGALLGGSAVAYTIQSLIFIRSTEAIILSSFTAVLSALIWNLITSRYGLPSSSTHALIGGLVGAAVVAEGLNSVNWGVSTVLAPQPEVVGLLKIIVLMAISVFIGLIGGYLLTKSSKIFLRNARRVINKPINKIQIVTAGLLSFSHGANDTQKQIAVIMIVLVASGTATAFDLPLVVRISCAAAMALGTLLGGWKVMRTLAGKLYRLQPIHSLNAQVVSTASVLFSTAAGAPVSSTHVVSSSIIGIGAAENVKMIDWTLGKEIFVSWMITLPFTMFISGFLYYILSIILK